MSQLYLTPSKNSKKTIITAGVSAFIGMLVAVPVSVNLITPSSHAGASASPANTIAQSPNPSDLAQVYAQYSHAYTQGYSAASASDEGEAHCGDGVVAASHVQALTPSLYVKGASVNGAGTGPAPSYDEWVKHVTHSYNTTQDYSSSITSYINSNNVVGSHNTSSTETNTNVEVKDSLGVLVNTHTNNNTSQSTHYNGNTEISDSGNTTNTNVEETNYETNVVDSFNTDTDVDTDIDIDVENEVEVEHTEVEIDDSFNEVEGGRPDYQVVEA